MWSRYALALMGLLLSSGVLADKPKFGDTWAFRAGGMKHNADVTFSSTREGRPEFELDLDKLGMRTDTTTFWVDAEWQFADRWGLNVVYTDFDSDGVETATEAGNFGDIEWSVDAELTSHLDLSLYIVDVTWDFMKTDRSHLGVGVGLHVADLDTGIDFVLEGQINGQPAIIERGTDTTKITAPLPNISLRAGHRFGDHLYLGGRAGYFSLTVGDIDGELVTARANLEWRPQRHFGLGIGYQYVSLDVEDDDGTVRDRYDADFYGPVLFVSAGF